MNVIWLLWALTVCLIFWLALAELLVWVIA